MRPEVVVLLSIVLIGVIVLRGLNALPVEAFTGIVGTVLGGTAGRIIPAIGTGGRRATDP